MLYTQKIAELVQERLQSLVIDEKDFDGDDSYQFRVVMTDETIDRYTEVLKADGMEYEQYLKNPVILADHHYTVSHIIGKATKIIFDAENSRRICEGVFSKTNPLADIARKLYAEGMLKTVSVWLIPKQRAENDRDVVTKRELLELSFVAVPANPNALSLDEKSYAMAKDAWLITDEEEEKEEETPETSDLEEVKTLLKTIVQDIAEIKANMVDDKTDEPDQALIDAKETMQEVARTISEWLRNIKIAKK